MAVVPQPPHSTSSSWMVNYNALVTGLSPNLNRILFEYCIQLLVKQVQINANEALGEMK